MIKCCLVLLVQGRLWWAMIHWFILTCAALLPPLPALAGCHFLLSPWWFNVGPLFGSTLLRQVSSYLIFFFHSKCINGWNDGRLFCTLKTTNFNKMHVIYLGLILNYDQMTASHLDPCTMNLAHIFKKRLVKLVFTGDVKFCMLNSNLLHFLLSGYITLCSCSADSGMNKYELLKHQRSLYDFCEVALITVSDHVMYKSKHFQELFRGKKAKKKPVNLIYVICISTAGQNSGKCL